MDIQGIEDFFGDMDFKVGGTKKGITAIQVDIKVDGLTYEIIEEAFAKTHKARDYILDEIMLKAIDTPRATVSKYAPKMLSTKIDTDKIGGVIGKGGKVIQQIQADCNCVVNVEEDGTVTILSTDLADANRALQIIETIAKDPEIGAIYKGKVTPVNCPNAEEAINRCFLLMVEEGWGAKEADAFYKALAKLDKAFKK